MPRPLVTESPRKTCPVERFGRPHVWQFGFWHEGEWYAGDDFVKCAACGQIEED